MQMIFEGLLATRHGAALSFVPFCVEGTYFFIKYNLNWLQVSFEVLILTLCGLEPANISPEAEPDVVLIFLSGASGDQEQRGFTEGS